MTKYHFSPKTNKPEKCSSPDNCDYKDFNGGQHFDTVKEANENMEKANATLYGGLATVKKTSAKSTVYDKKKMQSMIDDFEKEIAKMPQPDPEKNLDSVFSDDEGAPYSMRPRGSGFIMTEEELSEEEELEYYGKILDENTVIYYEHCRQGGGNRDCYCDGDTYEDGHEDGCLALNNEIMEEHKDYITDADSYGDSTYATFYFRVDRKKAEEHLENEEVSRKITHAENLLKAMKNGEKAPWHKNQGDNFGYSYAKSNRDRKMKMHEDGKAELKELKKVEKIIKSGGEKMTDMQFIEDYFGNNYNMSSDKRMTRLHAEYANDKREQLISLERELSELKQLPENSELRKLHYDRADAAVTSKKKALKNDEEKVASYFNKSLSTKKERAQEKIDSWDEKEFNKIRQQAWSEDFPGKKSDLPPIPDTF